MDLSDSKEEVRKAADIVEVIGQYVQLKRRGQNYTGLCPFHSERSPSFTVNQNKQIYHCFGCGRGGDVFAFWMEYHNVDFPQSLEGLAERYNITLQRDKNAFSEKKKTELKEQLLKANNIAGSYFHTVLAKSAGGKPGREYFLKRKISEEIVSKFMLGYAPDRWDGLVNYLKSKDIPWDLAEKAGLLVSRESGGYYDRFRGRIIFPIFDLNHHIIGFGGRVLDDSLPKYINTPETPIYHKGNTLYGLDSAYKDIREMGLAIIVEGYMDVLVLRQHGISNVVATLGTALTSDQIRRLKGYTKDVIVLFDPDDAGKEAALKSFPLFLNEGISAKVTVLPKDEDPDSFVNKYGPDAFRKILKKAVPIFDFYLDQALGKIDSGIDGQIKLLGEVLPIFMELEQGATRFLYVQRFAERAGINENSVWEELRHRESGRQKHGDISKLRNRLSPVQGPRKYSSDLHFLNLMVHYPEKIDTFRHEEWELVVSDPVIVKIIRVLMERFPFEGSLNKIEEFFDSTLARDQLRSVLMAGSFYSEESVNQAVTEFEKKIAMVKITKSIRKAKAEGDIERLNYLIRERQHLDYKNQEN
ncbi:MAG TPA: DNA primase [Desulfatiglandales bacterium]|nr:DNA primase [Desulfatiglandales bacterium]